MTAPPFFIAQVQPGEAQFDAWPEHTLLESAEAGGIDWPSSCRNGTCRTCLGTLCSGTVGYRMEWPGLSAEEKAQGGVLPCVAHPLSDLVLSRSAP